ncbi:AMP-binding protein [Paenibacillus wenxiniae]|uniref:AMP-binding protein n=1 Tax=Paenibacillus wenxiniae TaxID=1636843 RepID=A0ABW4RPD8_9BACL
MSQLVHDFLIDNLYKTSNNILLKEYDHTLTHGELHDQSNQFCNYLYSLGVKKGERVALLMDSSIHSIIALVGIMKKGAIYVPINTSSSEDVIEYIINETEVSTVIADAKYCNKLDQLSMKKDLKLIIHGSASEDQNMYVFEKYSDFEVHIQHPEHIISSDIINIVFTSGTTGTPKGVIVRHECITPFMNYVTKRFHHNEATRTLSDTPLSFDPFLTEIVPSFIGGGFVYLYKGLMSINKFLKVIERENITNFGCGPSLLLLLSSNKHILQEYDLSSLQEIYFGYESCPTTTIQTLQTYLPNVTFINGYGTTETYASSTFHEITYPVTDEIKNFPIGDPIEGTELLVINEDNELTEPDEIGELVIRGNSIMSGYWKNQDATEKVLKVNPIFPESLEKVYFTGDLVKRLPNNDIIFVGRKDTQVKINGYRVELLEIQNIIEKHSLTKECCILAMNENDTNKIYCYLITENNSQQELDEIKTYLIAKLEPYKIPYKWIMIDRMPRNSNGKVDKKQLEILH